MRDPFLDLARLLRRGAGIVGADHDQGRPVDRLDAVALVHRLDGAAAAGVTVDRRIQDHVADPADRPRVLGAARRGDTALAGGVDPRGHPAPPGQLAAALPTTEAP